MPKWLLIFVVLIVLLAGGAYVVARRQAPAAQFRTVSVSRQDLTATIGATGTLEPEQVVDVGAQVNGQIIRFGPDEDHPGKTIDNRSNVETGMLLAKIDDRPYQFALEDAKAGVDSAKANIAKAEADLGQMEAKLFQANQDWNRVDKLGAANAGISEQERDQYKANLLVAQANVADQQAVIDQAKTTLAQTKAALLQAQQNVDYCTINSPVKGTVIARRMNAGQTVNSSMSAPSLFLIAKDLRRMQVWAAVNEADVGNIHSGQSVSFTVDARPGQTFDGVVDKVRYDATMTQNVVTYTVEITVDNSDGRLLPYLTANVQFHLDPRVNAQVVPNAALRWVPPANDVAPGADERAPAAPVSARPTTGPVNDGMRDRGTVWLVAGPGQVRPVRVRVGVTDGTVTEVAAADGDTLLDNAAVVTAEVDPTDSAGAGTANPFVPQWGKRRR